MGVLLPTELRKQFCNHLKNPRMDFLDALVQNVFAGRTHLPPIYIKFASNSKFAPNEFFKLVFLNVCI